MDHVVGHFAAGSGRIEGWCWASDRPDERVVVEILINGEVAASVTASALDLNIRARKIGDGYHGFSLPMPELPRAAPEQLILEAREHKAQQLFGRVVIHRSDAAVHSRLSDLDARIDQCNDRLTQLQTANIRRRLPFADLAVSLQQQAMSFKPGMPRGARTAIAKTAKIHAVPAAWIATPDVSLIIEAGQSAEGVYRAISRLHPLLQHHGVEVVLLDDGADPLTALLGTRLRNLNYVFAPQEDAPAARNSAAAVARGRYLCFAGELPGDVFDVLRQIEELMTAPLVLGPRPVRLAMKLGYVSDAVPADRAKPLDSFYLCAEAATFQKLGGLDETLEDAGLAAVDFMLKARLLAIKTICRSSARAYAEPPVHLTVGYPSFCDRWGRR